MIMWKHLLDYSRSHICKQELLSTVQMHHHIVQINFNTINSICFDQLYCSSWVKPWYWVCGKPVNFLCRMGHFCLLAGKGLHSITIIKNLIWGQVLPSGTSLISAESCACLSDWRIWTLSFLVKVTFFFNKIVH